MVKKIRPVVVAVVVGCTLALGIFRVVEEKTLLEPSGNVVAIQLGVFKDMDSASKMKNTYGGEVFENDGIYRVYYSILNKDDNIEYITEYLRSKGVSFYLKPMTVETQVLKDGLEYETVMEKTSEKAKLSINSELLNMYKEVV